MTHNLPLITTLAAAFSLALIVGFLAERIRIPAMVGYLVAGILIGPATPGFVANIQLASQLSEVGVILLMFGVGLHFSLEDLLAVRRIAIPGAIVQMTLATLQGIALAHWWGWSFGSGLIFGLSLSCASTVVLLKALEANRETDSTTGRIAIGWLIVEDLATVFVLLFLPTLGNLFGTTVISTKPLWVSLTQTLLQVFAFISLMWIAGRRILPWLLWQVARTGSRELFTLAIVASAIGIAYGAAELFSVSFSLGAFFAGTVMRESEFSHRAARESLPLRDAFSVLFFVSVGMLFKPSILINQPLHVLGVTAIIMVGKSVAACALVLAFRYPLKTALTVAVSLAQIGEFSFMLAGLGVSLKLLPPEGMSLVLVGALFSIALNPIAFATIGPIDRWLNKHSRWARNLENPVDPFAALPESTGRNFLQGQIVLIGYGVVGKRIAQTLHASGLPFVIADQNREVVEKLRRRGYSAVFGNASEPTTLIQAHINDADMLIVTTADAIDAQKMGITARALNPDIDIVLVARNQDEARMLRREGLGVVIYNEEVIAKEITQRVLTRTHNSGEIK